jgi:hypothetical protein
MPPSMVADSVLQLRGLLVQLDHADRKTQKEEVARLFQELIQIGRRWPDQPVNHHSEEEQKAFDRLSRHLKKFPDAEQRDIVATFRPLREEIHRRLGKVADDLNAWLREIPENKANHAERLAAIVQGIEGAPQLKWYKLCTNSDNKAKFFMALASVTRSVQAESAPLHAHVTAHPSVLPSIERLSRSFFIVPQHGNILKLWHDGRLKRYNATLWRAAKSAADAHKDDLQVRLVTALRRKASQVAAQGAKARPHLQLELCKWPMVNCPLATAFLDFVAQRGHELGDLGRPQLSECPPHSLRPRTLCKLLERLDAFELVEDDKNKDTPIIVRLRWEAVTALAFKALGTKPKASSVPPTSKAESPSGAVAESASGVVSAEESMSSSSPELGPARPPNAGPPASKAAARQAPPPRQEAAGDNVHRAGAAAATERALAAAGGSHKAKPSSVLAVPEQQAGNRARPVKRPLDASSGSVSESSLSPEAAEKEREREERKRKEKKKRRKMDGMLGYGGEQNKLMGNQSLNQMMMMNQMMGMSMMMNNPMAMMGMANPMMPQMMASAGMKLKKEDKVKKVKGDSKLKKVPTPPPPPAPKKETEDPHLNKPATRDVSLIDADDL